VAIGVAAIGTAAIGSAASLPAPRAPAPGRTSPPPPPVTALDEDAPSSPKRQLPGDPALWPAFVASLELTGFVGQLAAQTELVRCSGRDLVLAVPDTHRHLADKSYTDKLKAALEQATGQKLRLAVELSTAADASLAALARREREQQRAQTEAAFRDEPFVRDAVAQLGARINPDSIKPVP
jgi:DNA polymerase-3 subunit gamma/tau